MMKIWTKALLAVTIIALFCGVAVAFEFAPFKQVNIVKTGYDNSVQFDKCKAGVTSIEEQTNRLTHLLIRHSTVSRMALSQAGVNQQDAQLTTERSQTLGADRHCGRPS